MDFGVHGTTTPRSYQRHLPGSARFRPQSGKAQRNPITGEEYTTPSPRHEIIRREPTKNGHSDRPSSRGDVPSLNLKYLADDDVKTGAIDIDLKDYSLDTPNSASTVSWGTGRSGRSTYGKSVRPLSTVKSTQRPEGVPGLVLGNEKVPSARRQPRQPTAWDKDPVPENVAAPSARYKEMYQQYADEMKESYRAHAMSSRVQQKDVDDAVERLRIAREAVKESEEKLRSMALEEEKEREPAQDVLDESWKRQRYSGKQLAKKLDVEDLVEHNKKQKLVETVMIDQLSRAVISDPKQNERATSRPLSSARRGRGSHRYLHDSKISTSSTATENLLSKRVRFGARIITKNGHNAMKELTGFYFDFDRTITVYEFRQFGKSAKAMPFIYRGQYVHQSGPKEGYPFSLSDIYTGANLRLLTEGQLALTESLAENETIVLRITDVDEEERQILLAQRDDDDDERNHAPSKIDIENREFLYMIQDEIQDRLRKRGIRTITGLNRLYRKMDQYNTGILDQYDLEKGLKTYHIDLEPEKLETVFDILAPSGSQLLDYKEYISGVIGEMNEYRKALVRRAFLKLDGNKKGSIHISDVKKFFNVNAKYKPADGDTSTSALQAFLEAVRLNDKQELVSYMEFEEYYEGLSLGIDSDEDFANVLRNTWNI